MKKPPGSQAHIGLRTKTTKLFGVIIPSITNPIFVRLFLHWKNERTILAMTFCFVHSLNKPEREEHCIRFLRRACDGTFYFAGLSLWAEARIYQEILARKTPTVLPRCLLAPFCKTFRVARN